ncbi:MAG: TatD family hydrolase [Firmicutes bacterium]|nr:TatD family hydrolase [Bacillota bacterium]
MLFDSHAHLDDKKIYADLEGVLQRAEEAGVTRIATIGCDWPSSLMSVRLAEKYPGRVFATVGIHPQDAETLNEPILEKLYRLAQAEAASAVGEIGLDYHYDGPSREIQQKAFRRQIDLAKQLSLPIAIHNRESHEDMMRIIKQEKAGVNGGVLHCFSGSWEMAKFCLNQGFMISFAGPVTFHNARSAVEVAQKAPADMILVETDSPYLSPEPFRGKTNEPARVKYVAEKLAELRGVDFETLAWQTTENALRLYHIDGK